MKGLNQSLIRVLGLSQSNEHDFLLYLKKVEFWLKPKFFLGGDAGYILSKKDDDDDLGSSHTYL